MNVLSKLLKKIQTKIRSSIASRLLVSVLLGALIGLGSMSFLFYRVLATQAAQEIQFKLDLEVRLMESEIAGAQQALKDLTAAAKSLQRRGGQDAELYKQLVFDVFQERDSTLVTGFGLGQAPHGLVGDREWYWPYFFIDQHVPDQIGRPLAPPYQEIRYAELFAEDNYPEQNYYRLPVKTAASTWLGPYAWSNTILMSYDRPIYDDDNQLLGAACIDIDISSFNTRLDSPVIRSQGSFYLMNETGQIMANPNAPELVDGVSTYEQIPGLQNLWPQISESDVGLLGFQGRYWAYQHLPRSRWIMVATVPQWAVAAPVLGVAVGGGLGGGAILGAVVLIFAQGLNRRFKPIIDECQALIETDLARSERLDDDAVALVMASGLPDDLSEGVDSSSGNISGETSLEQKHEASLSNAYYSDSADELDLLAYSFSSMAKQLKSSFENLESKVADRTQDLTLAMEAADSANQAKSEFLANMSHELRTPLNGILGYAQILANSNHLQPREQDGVRIINQCGSHLLTLINDILDLSKIESRKMELLEAPFHFPASIRGVVEICQIKAQEKGIHFNYHNEGTMPEGIISDDKRLRQVLINLLSNAIKFTPAGHVIFQVITQSLDADRYHLRFEVQDTGLGISPENLEKIFLPFEQADNPDAAQIEGTGLGLAISQRIVRMLGGELQVTSQLGEGSVFAFEMDVQAAQDWIKPLQGKQCRRVVGFEGSAKTILMVDDRWENRSVVFNLLTPLGFEVMEAEEGRQGLAMASDRPPDLIITDLSMPVMDGFEFLEAVRVHPQLQSLPILVSSASVFQADQQRSLDAGGDRFLSKPVQFDQLLDALEDYLELDWIYEQNFTNGDEGLSEDAGEASEVLVAPATAELLHLQKLARSGLLNDLLDELDRLEKADPHLRTFTSILRGFAQKFQLKQMKALLEEHLTVKT